MGFDNDDNDPTQEELAALIGDRGNLPWKTRCNIPSPLLEEGWRCTRDPRHSGPCAMVPPTKGIEIKITIHYEI